MAYEPEDPPWDTKTELGSYLIRELRRIADAFTEVENIKLRKLHVEPVKPRDGMVILADGNDFDPGKGEGFYGYLNQAWVPFGSRNIGIVPPAAQLAITTTAPELP